MLRRFRAPCRLRGNQCFSRADKARAPSYGLAPHRARPLRTRDGPASGVRPIDASAGRSYGLIRICDPPRKEWLLVRTEVSPEVRWTGSNLKGPGHAPQNRFDPWARWARNVV